MIKSLVSLIKSFCAIASLFTLVACSGDPTAVATPSIEVLTPVDTIPTCIPIGHPQFFNRVITEQTVLDSLFTWVRRIPSCADFTPPVINYDSSTVVCFTTDRSGRIDRISCRVEMDTVNKVYTCIVTKHLKAPSDPYEPFVAPWSSLLAYRRFDSTYTIIFRADSVSAVL
jgi:hypothetical protein